MLYDEIMKIVTLAGELMLQAQDEELTVFDKEGTANFVVPSALMTLLYSSS